MTHFRSARLPSLRHVAHGLDLREIAEAIEGVGIFKEEQPLFFLAEQGRPLQEIPAHAVGDGRHGARIIRAPHELVHAAEIPRRADGLHRGGIGIVFRVEQPGDAAALDAHVGMARQLQYWDFPGGPVAKTQSSQCRGAWVQSLVRKLDPMCCN